MADEQDEPTSTTNGWTPKPSPRGEIPSWAPPAVDAPPKPAPPPRPDWGLPRHVVDQRGTSPWTFVGLAVGTFVVVIGILLLAVALLGSPSQQRFVTVGSSISCGERTCSTAMAPPDAMPVVASIDG